MAGGRPYKTFAQLLAAAELAWRDLSDAAWLEAFAAHPRNINRNSNQRHNQSTVMEGSTATLTTLAAENREYEARFGHVFLVAASGRGADEVLAALRERMANDPATELRVAAAEQRKITRLRLEKLLNA